MAKDMNLYMYITNINFLRNILYLCFIARFFLSLKKASLFIMIFLCLFTDLILPKLCGLCTESALLVCKNDSQRKKETKPHEKPLTAPIPQSQGTHFYSHFPCIWFLWVSFGVLCSYIIVSIILILFICHV